MIKNAFLGFNYHLSILIVGDKIGQKTERETYHAALNNETHLISVGIDLQCLTRVTAAEALPLSLHSSGILSREAKSMPGNVENTGCGLGYGTRTFECISKT